jgi:hypothetical protein
MDCVLGAISVLNNMGGCTHRCLWVVLRGASRIKMPNFSSSKIPYQTLRKEFSVRPPSVLLRHDFYHHKLLATLVWIPGTMHGCGSLLYGSGSFLYGSGSLL